MKGKDTLLVPMTHEGEYNGKGVVGYKNLHFSSFEIVQPRNQRNKAKIISGGLTEVLISNTNRRSRL